MTERFTFAINFATQTHAGQIRKYVGEPYIFHPLAVVRKLRSVPHTPEMLVAAVLHDVVEDCDVSFETLRILFGPLITEYVEWLTQVSKPLDGNRATRKLLDLQHIQKAPPEAKTIKLADLLDNAEGIFLHDPCFAKVYCQEALALLEVLKEGDPTLWEALKQVLNQYRIKKENPDETCTS